MISAADKSHRWSWRFPSWSTSRRQLRRATLRALRQRNASAAPAPEVEMRSTHLARS